MFTMTAGLLLTICGVLIGFGCWWPPRPDRLTVDSLQRRLALENYFRHRASQWPIRTEVERDHEHLLTRLHAIVGPTAF